MINFRYHVVSLTAVFLALAIGLVVGTAALNGPVADSLKDTVDALGQGNSDLRAQNTQLNDELNRLEDFANEAAPALAGGKLANRKLLVVVMPSGQDYVEGVVTMLRLAGATVTARVTVQDKFLAPESGLELLDLADEAAGPTVPAAGLPRNSYGVETSSALLAAALLGRNPSAPVTPGDLKTVLTAYSETNYIAVSDGAVGGAEATVVVSGLPPVDREAASKSRAAVTVVTQFGEDNPLVVAGSGAGDGNLVSEVRRDPFLVKKISTVDNVTTVQGQLATALTTTERVVQGRTGQYGLATGATALIPKIPT